MGGPARGKNIELDCLFNEPQPTWNIFELQMCAVKHTHYFTYFCMRNGAYFSDATVAKFLHVKNSRRVGELVDYAASAGSFDIFTMCFDYSQPVHGMPS